eukprot:2817880-Rhodomonas_salina.1
MILATGSVQDDFVFGRICFSAHQRYDPSGSFRRDMGLGSLRLPATKTRGTQSCSSVGVGATDEDSLSSSVFFEPKRQTRPRARG